MAFEAEQGVVAAHAEAVVGDADEATPAGTDFNGDFFGVRIEGVFDELLDDARGALHDFASGDLVGDLFGKELDAVHRRAKRETWGAICKVRGWAEAKDCRKPSGSAALPELAAATDFEFTHHSSLVTFHFTKGKVKEKIAPRPASPRAEISPP